MCCYLVNYDWRKYGQNLLIETVEGYRQRGEQMLRDSLEPESPTVKRLKVKGDKITHGWNKCLAFTTIVH